MILWKMILYLLTITANTEEGLDAIDIQDIIEDKFDLMKN